MATRVLEMTFLTALSQKSTMNVSNVKDPFTGAEAAALMDSIIAANIFNTDTGALTSKSSARIITTDTADLSLL